jgi:hypothetical protein
MASAWWDGLIQESVGIVGGLGGWRTNRCLLSIAGRIAHHARSTHPRLPAHAPHVDLLIAGLQQLIALPAPN